MNRIEELEDLLRSAHAIAARKGEGTAWERFAARCAALGIGSITAKTFRVMPDEPEYPRAKAVADALAERARQDQKWGEQNHDPVTWSAILTEECGEFAEAALHHRFGGPAASGLRNEAVQVAAVALQIVECIDRNAGKVGCALCDRGDGQLGHADNCPNAK